MPFFLKKQPITTMIAVWSNKGAPVAYMSGDHPVCVRYNSEEPVATQANGIKRVEYDPGIHRYALSKLRKNPDDTDGEDGIFIQKHKTNWVKIGMIAYANVQETGNAILYIVDTPPAVLATNKPDALRALGYTKQMGKGTGTYQMGVCRIKPIEYSTFMY